VYMTAAAAAVIVVRRRQRQREQHQIQRDAWSRQWLLNRTSARGISNFIDYELCDDTLGFHSFLHVGSSEFKDILNEIAGDIMRMDTVMHDSVTPKDKTCVAFCCSWLCLSSTARCIYYALKKLICQPPRPSTAAPCLLLRHRL